MYWRIIHGLYLVAIQLKKFKTKNEKVKNGTRFGIPTTITSALRYPSPLQSVYGDYMNPNLPVYKIRSEEQRECMKNKERNKTKT